MSKIKLPHASGNSMSIGAPATNPASDLELKLPATIGTAHQPLKNTSTPGTLEYGYRPGEIMETFMIPCNGSSYTVVSGTYTSENVTAVQTLTTSYVDLTGSSITYTPPSDAKVVIYKFSFHSDKVDAKPMFHLKLFLDGVEVERNRLSSWEESAQRQIIEWPFQIGGSADTAIGKVASWTSGKTIKCQIREYTSSYEGKVHETYHWDGTQSAHLVVPTISMTAIA